NQLKQVRCDEWHVPGDYEHIVAGRERCVDSREPTCVSNPVSQNSDTRQPLGRLRAVGNKCQVRRHPSQCIRDPIDDSLPANFLKSLRSAAESAARAAGKYGANEGPAAQMRRPRRSAAESSSAVSMRSTSGESM